MSFCRQFKLIITKTRIPKRSFATTLARRDVIHDAPESVFREHVSTVKDKVVIVDFYEDWCPPCKVLSPLLEQVEKDPTLIGATVSSLDLITLKGELVPSLFDEHRIRSIPTVMAFYNGTKVGEFVGAKDIPKMKEWYATLAKVPRPTKGV